MALTQSQRDAIKRQMKKNLAKRAETQRTKISDSEARKASSTMNKRAGGSPSYTLKDRNVLSKSEANELGRTLKSNAAQERARQRQRNFAKGVGKLPIKDRVGTKSEYKQLGKDIETMRELIARGKAARAAKAERARNPKPATLTKATPAKVETPVATQKTTPAKKTMPAKKNKPAKPTMRKKAAVAPKPVVNTPTPEAPKLSKGKTAPKSKGPKTKTPKAPTAPKLQTLDQARASAPKPRGPMLGPAKPVMGPLVDQPRFFPGPQKPKAAEAPSKPTAKAKVTSKIASTKTGSTLKAASKTTAGKSITGVAKKIGNNKLVKVGGKLVKVGAAINLGKEIAQVGSGQAEKDFRRIQALENRIAAAKGQKPKYTKTGSSFFGLENAKTNLSNLANAATMGAVGQSRKGRLAELKTIATKVGARKPGPNGTLPAKAKPKAGKTPVVTMPNGKTAGGNTPAKAPMGNNYTVKKGDTLSGIASRSGVSLKELRAANPKFATQAKYKNGNMIFSGTKVALPKKKAK